MASKRTANSDLNADNWNDDDEPEEPGRFQQAPQEILSKRVVRTAKRRLQAAGSEETKSAFGSFSGFKTATTTPTVPSSLFSFLVKTSAESSSTTSVTSTFVNKTPASNGNNKITENGLGVSVSSSSSVTKDTKPESTAKENSPKKSSKYFSKLKGLNQSVAKWIQQHVDANPVCILTPIFRDYEKYLKQIDSECEDNNFKTKPSEVKPETKPTEEVKETKKQDNFTFDSSNVSTEKKADVWKSEKSIFGSSNTMTKSIFSTSEKTENSPFSSQPTEKNIFFKSSTAETKKDEETVVKKDDKSSTGTPFSSQTSSLSLPSSPPSATFSFGQSTITSTASAGFSFGGSKPFSFGADAVKPAEPEGKKEENDDEEEEPPKPEFKPIVEEGSIFDQKCKVFIKKDGNYSDRGVGTLFLKPAPNDKMQLIVRASNSLGNLLLNTLLSDKIPIKRLNKTNIMLVCLPMPTAEPPPVATLLRVKTAEEADALFEALEKHKK